MATEYPLSCEPLRVWSRLEPRARRVDFDRALQARVHDPLWMLARQWQFGEFKGEDTGSAIMVKIARKVTTLSGLRTNGSMPGRYSPEVPLEARVERVPIDPTGVMRAHAARRFLSILDARGAQLPLGAPAYDPAHYRDLFRRVFPLTVSVLDDRDPADAIALARRKTQEATYRMQLALAGRCFDGVALLAKLRPGMTWSDVPGELAIGVIPEHADFVLGALLAYQAWWSAVYILPQEQKTTAWNSSQLEYQFACSLARQENAEMILGADEYASGRLDWYSFEQRETIPQSTGLSSPQSIQVDIRTAIPTPAEFAGMPNARWWQFEDAAVDLGHIRADATDVAKIAVAEFALLYGNNWFVIPCSQAVGTLAEIEGMVVIDVFGWRSSVGPATGGSHGNWARWDFFSLSPRNTATAAESLGQHLLLPPALGTLLEGDPLESVALVRDEMTNTVWAVETRVPDGMGEGADGSTAARRFRVALEQLESTLRPPSSAAPVPNPILRYRLGTSIPENWIPFVPVHKPGDTRAIRLQRASMPRFFLDSIAPVRPLTAILREGLREDDSQDRPYFIHEEEVPSAGVAVESAFQRTRWFDGTTYIWQGRRKSSGRGGGSSGLRFDAIDVSDKRT